MNEERPQRHPDYPSRYAPDSPDQVERRRGSSTAPLGQLRPVVAIAVAYGLAAVLWAAVGDPLPGGRWLAIHLFTLGTVTNLIATMTDHFSRTLTKVPGDGRRGWRLGVLNAGILLVVVALPQGWSVALAAGGTITVIAVVWLMVALRRMRVGSVGARFAFVVRAYEWACWTFLAGAVIGALLGAGLVPGAWHQPLRMAHLAVNVLGWGGLVLLATVVFFAPTVMRTRIAAGAERLARPALPAAATGVALAAVGLVLAGAPAPMPPAGRALAVAGLAVYSAATVAVCLPALQAARRAVRSSQADAIAAACAWFPAAAVAATVGVAWQASPLIEAAGVLLLLGVLGQAIVGALIYFLPMVTGRGPDARSAQRDRLAPLRRVRIAALNLGVAFLATGVALADTSAGASGALHVVGWLLIGPSVAVTVALGVAAVRVAGAPTGTT